VTQQHGATVSGAATTFRVRAPKAHALWLCLFEGETEHRLPMIREGADWVAKVPRLSLIHI
jgi:glycogen operon protein